MMAVNILRRIPSLVRPHARCMSYVDKITKDVQSRNPLRWTDQGDHAGHMPNRPPKQVDIVVIGGGVMGSSVAYFLRRQAEAGVSVLVVERDTAYTRASSVLSAGGIRQQFSVPENILMSLYSAHFFKNIKQNLCVDDADPPDIQFNQQGYLLLSPHESAAVMEENFKIQTELGAKLELMSPNQLKDRFPWLNTDGVALGSYGLENEGWFDPYLLTTAFKHKAESLGARYCQGEVIGFECSQVEQGAGTAIYSGAGKRIKAVKVRMPNSPEVIDVSCSMAIVCAGAWSADVTAMLDIGKGSEDRLLDVPLPVEPRKRYIYVAHCPDGPGIDSPFTINTDGAYFRREGLGGNYIMGRCPETEQDEPSTSDLSVDYEFFEEKIWPSLAKTVPSFECLKLKSAWAGYYDYNTVDQNAIIGTHPAFPNLFMATGFSGHGIQQSPAVGQIISDLVFDSRHKEINVSRLGFERFLTKTPVREVNVF